MAPGIPGGWSILTNTTVGGVRFIHPVNTDKCGSIVAARVASALGGLGIAATSDTRRSNYDPVRLVDSSYVDDIASFIVDEMYGKLSKAGSNPLLTKSTVVFSSVHRYGLYVSEALHARFLPLQFIGFADTWEQVVNASRGSMVIAGLDFDYDKIWVWNKVAAGGDATTAAGQLPSAYQTALSEADNVVVVQPDDQWVPDGCTPSYCVDVISDVYTPQGDPSMRVFVHSSLKWAVANSKAGQLYQEAKNEARLSAPTAADISNIKQWEWCVPDTAVANLMSAWQSGGKPGSRFHHVKGGVNTLFSMSAKLWKSYLDQNSRAPRGFHVSSYWYAHPQLERAGALLPFPSYIFIAGWQGIDDEAKKLMADTMAATPSTPTSSYASNTRVFVNSVGSSNDPPGVKALLTDLGLTPASGLAYYGDGFDLADAGGAAPTGWNGDTVPKAHLVVAAAIQNATLAPFTNPSDWQPLSLTSPTALVFSSAAGGWDVYQYNYSVTPPK